MSLLSPSNHKKNIHLLLFNRLSTIVFYILFHKFKPSNLVFLPLTLLHFHQSPKERKTSPPVSKGKENQPTGLPRKGKPAHQSPKERETGPPVSQGKEIQPTGLRRKGKPAHQYPRKVEPAHQSPEERETSPPVSQGKANQPTSLPRKRKPAH